MPPPAAPPAKEQNLPRELGMSSWMTAMKENPVQSESGAVSGTPPVQTPPPTPEKAVATPPVAEAKAPDAPPAKPTPPVEPEDAKWPRTSADWKKFKEARELEKTGYEAKLKEYEAKVETLSKQPAAPTDYEAIKKQAEEYSGIIQQISVENHPKFKAYYDGLTNRQVELAKSIVGTDMAEAVTEILSMPDGKLRNEKIDEIFTTLSPSQQARLGGVVNQITNIQQERANEVKKSKETYEAIQKQKVEESQAKGKMFETMFETETKKLQDEHPAFQKREGDDAWNAEVDQRIETTKKYLFGNDMKPEQIIRAAADAVALPVLLKQNLGLLEKVSTLEKQVAELSSASPKIPDKSATPTNGEPPRIDPIKAGSRPMEVMGGWIKNLPALGR